MASGIDPISAVESVTTTPVDVERIEAAVREILIADRKSTRLNSSHSQQSRMPSSA